MRWGLGAFRNSVYKAHAQAFPFFFFLFFSFFLFYFPFFCLLGSAICIYRAYISRTHIILRVRRPSVVPYSVSAVAKGGGNASTSPPTPTPLSLPFGSFRLSVIYKKKQQKYVGKNKKCFVLSGLRFCSILFGATTKKFYLCPIYESGNALACVCAYFLLTS